MIFAAQGRVHGLTTAASLFAAAAIGLTAGLDELAIAAVLAVVAVAVLWPLLAERILASVAPRERVVQLVAAELGTLADVRRVLADLDVRARELDLRGTAHGVEARLVVRRDDAYGRAAARTPGRDRGPRLPQRGGRRRRRLTARPAYAARRGM